MCFHISTKASTQSRNNNTPNKFVDYYHVSGFDHPKIGLLYNGNIISSHWGLIPHWVRNEQQALLIRNKTLNARIATLESKPSFKDVSFKYYESLKNVLNKVNLEFKSDQMTALVGHSGAGKSTILNFIPRFYEPLSGKIYIDNQPIDQHSLSSLRENISLVSQDISLFDDTIKNNIKYSRLTASDEEIIEAAKLSNCNDFVKSMPNGYDTVIGENGVKLSGGEKQRLSIARAILKKSKIILLDEATSSLDAETEDKIQKAINYLTKNKTTIVIAHRLSTVLNSDKIYVIDSGNVVAEGNHNELLNTSSIYKNFYDKQLKS